MDSSGSNPSLPRRNTFMNFQKTVFIGLVILTIIGAIGITVKLVLDYQKTEKQYQACLEQCLCPSESYRPIACRLCESKCNEKYGR